MKNVKALFFLLLIIASSCEVVNHSPQDQTLEEEILNDDDFKELIHSIEELVISQEHSTTTLWSLIGVIQPLNERYVIGRSIGEQKTFERTFNNELGWGSMTDRLPGRYFDTQYEMPAGIDVVWEHITNVDAYPEWNPFTPMVETEFEVGGPIVMHVRLFPLLPDALLVQEETVVTYYINEMTCWETELISSFFFRSHRCYEVETIDAEHTMLVNSMIYEGLLAPLVNSLTKPLVLAGFHDMSQTLIERLED